MRLIDADKLYPDCLTKRGALAISQSQIANAPTAEAVDFEYHSKLIKQAYQKGKDIRPQGEWIEDDNHNIVCPFCGGHRRDCRIDHINFCNRCGADLGGKEE